MRYAMQLSVLFLQPHSGPLVFYHPQNLHVLEWFMPSFHFDPVRILLSFL